MRSVEEVKAVQDLLDVGLSDCEIERRTGVPRRTVMDWRRKGPPGQAARADAEQMDPQHVPYGAYSYLLGLYLGDGHIVANRRGVYRLSIYLDQRYPEIIAECRSAIAAVRGKPAALDPQIGCIRVNAYSKHWPALFPQHGPGPKHLRPIALADWQQEIVDEQPELFLRGLIQSDGCRVINRVTVRGMRYAYPRYQFTNASDDIRRMFCDTCDAIGVEWRVMNARNISVARRASVARLDGFIGPKR